MSVGATVDPAGAPRFFLGGGGSGRDETLATERGEEGGVLVEVFGGRLTVSICGFRNGSALVGPLGEGGGAAQLLSGAASITDRGPLVVTALR
ncbi:MAG: hypothetical protein ABIO94_06195 [Opitutaceae bacterium]